MMEKLEGQHDTYIVHYSVLDGDRQGRPPNDPHFDKAHKSCLHKIAKSNNKASVIPSVWFLLPKLWERMDGSAKVHEWDHSSVGFITLFLYCLTLPSVLSYGLAFADSELAIL